MNAVSIWGPDYIVWSSKIETSRQEHDAIRNMCSQKKPRWVWRPSMVELAQTYEWAFRQQRAAAVNPACRGGAVA